MDLLIFNDFAEYLKSKLGPKFSEVSIHAAVREEDIGDIIGKIPCRNLKQTPKKSIRRHYTAQLGVT